MNTSAPTKHEILRKRAEKLAMALSDRLGVQEHLIEAVVFKLGEESYAIESRFIEEVYPLKDYTPLPTLPPFVYGIVNIRRKIISLINLKVFFDFPSHQDSPSNKVLIVHNSEIEFGILIDEVIGVRRLVPEEIQTSLPTLTGYRQEFFKGVTADRLIVLDGDKLLNNKKIIINATNEGV